MGTTPTYQLPYPDSSDPADVPLDMRELAERIELVFPVRELAYTEWTAAIGISATTEGAAQVVVTAPALSFDGVTNIDVEFFCPNMQAPLIVGGYMRAILRDNGVSITNLLAQVNSLSSSAATAVPGFARRRLTPASGSHQFSIAGFLSAAGSGTFFAGPGGAGQISPGFIRVLRV